MNPLKLHYSKALAIAAAVVGALLLLVGLLTMDVIQIFAGVVLTLLGILTMVNPIFVIENGEAQQRSPLGFTTRRFPVSGPADLRAEEKRLVHVPTGKKIASLGFGVNKEDVARIRASVPGPDAVPNPGAGPAY